MAEAENPETGEQTQPEVTESAEPKPATGQSHLERFKRWYAHHKKWTIPGSVLLLLIILAIIPWTRYKAAGLVVKKDVIIFVTDSKSGTAVSKAEVMLAGQQAETSGTGAALFHHVRTGTYKVSVLKKYYLDTSKKVTVGFRSPQNFQLQSVPTGRQVKIVVKNLINHKPLLNVGIKINDVTAKTDNTGTAVAVLPIGASSEKGSLILSGYNNTDVTVQISDQTVKENDYYLTPAGQIYFLSKLSGKIDVVKTNLDGSDRQTVLAGTGNEDDQNTVLLASRDWKYLALLSRRAGQYATLYLIDTTNNDSLSTIDEGNVTFNLAGWSGSNFVYTVTRSVSPTTPHGQALKSFDADSKQLLTLDKTNAAGNDVYNWAHETYLYQIYLIGKNVIYGKDWDNYESPYINSPSLLIGKQAGIYSIGVDGKNSQTLRTFALAADKYVNIVSVPYEAQTIYYQAQDPSGTSYYTYSNGKLAESSDLSDNFNKYYNNPKTFLESPSGNLTFWSEPRDGKNTLFVGDQNGEGGKQIASLSDYNTYGWYTENYLLVSKNSSELYVMSADGSQTPIKISDYHKPAQSYYGYGGGYGGI